jgi:hypothetical protein
MPIPVVCWRRKSQVRSRPSCARVGGGGQVELWFFVFELVAFIFAETTEEGPTLLAVEKVKVREVLVKVRTAGRRDVFPIRAIIRGPVVSSNPLRPADAGSE